MHATVAVESTGGVKVWLNGELTISAKEPGGHTIQNGVIREGWFRFE